MNYVASELDSFELVNLTCLQVEQMQVSSVVDEPGNLVVLDDGNSCNQHYFKNSKSLLWRMPDKQESLTIN